MELSFQGEKGSFVICGFPERSGVGFRLVRSVRIVDAEKQEISERVLMNAGQFRFSLPQELLPNPYRREATLYRSYFEYVLQGLSKGYLTPWQKRVTASLQEEAAN